MVGSINSKIKRRGANFIMQYYRMRICSACVVVIIGLMIILTGCQTPLVSVNGQRTSNEVLFLNNYNYGKQNSKHIDSLIVDLHQQFTYNNFQHTNFMYDDLSISDIPIQRYKNTLEFIPDQIQQFVENHYSDKFAIAYFEYENSRDEFLSHSSHASSTDGEIVLGVNKQYEYSSDATIHEYGHILDNVLGNYIFLKPIHETSIFKHIVTENSSKITDLSDSWYYEAPEEFLAGSFQYYCYYNKSEVMTEPTRNIGTRKLLYNKVYTQHRTSQYLKERGKVWGKITDAKIFFYALERTFLQLNFSSR
jgi:hypothetical protein